MFGYFDFSLNFFIFVKYLKILKDLFFWYVCVCVGVCACAGSYGSQRYWLLLELQLLMVTGLLV